MKSLPYILIAALRVFWIAFVGTVLHQSNRCTVAHEFDEPLHAVSGDGLVWQHLQVKAFLEPDFIHHLNDL